MALPGPLRCVSCCPPSGGNLGPPSAWTPLSPPTRSTSALCSPPAVFLPVGVSAPALPTAPGTVVARAGASLYMFAPCPGSVIQVLAARSSRRQHQPRCVPQTILGRATCPGRPLVPTPPFTPADRLAASWRPARSLAPAAPRAAWGPRGGAGFYIPAVPSWPPLLVPRQRALPLAPSQGCSTIPLWRAQRRPPATPAAEGHATYSPRHVDPAGLGGTLPRYRLSPSSRT